MSTVIFGNPQMVIQEPIQSVFSWIDHYDAHHEIEAFFEPLVFKEEMLMLERMNMLPCW